MIIIITFLLLWPQSTYKIVTTEKTNFYSLFKNVVKAESHTLHSCKGQRKFIALLCKILNLNDKVNLIALSNELVMKCCNWVLYGNKLYSIKWMKSINQVRKWAILCWGTLVRAKKALKAIWQCVRVPWWWHSGPPEIASKVWKA